MSWMKKPIRVGYVLKTFPRLSETFVLNEMLELERQGFDIEIFSLKAPTEPRFHSQLSQVRAPVTYLARGESGASWPGIERDASTLDLDPTSTGEAFLKCLRDEGQDYLKVFPSALSLAALARRRGIQHLHAHFASLATRTTVLAHMLSGVSFSFTAHAKDIYHHDVNQDVLSEALERAKFVVTVTDYNVARLEECNPPARGKIRRIYNGIDLDRFLPQPLPNTQPPEIISVGRLVEKKGFPFLIEACRLLKDRGRRLRCTIIGGGDHEQQLRELIAALDLHDTVSLTGPLSDHAVMDAITRGVMFVLPCVVGEDGNQDALPTVMLEAMALGRPVVSSDLAGVTEIVDHGETGLIAPQLDSRGLADAMDRLLGDTELQTACGRAGRRKAERLFNLRMSVGQLAALFRESVEPPEPGCVEAVEEAISQ